MDKTFCSEKELTIDEHPVVYVDVKNSMILSILSCFTGKYEYDFLKDDVYQRVMPDNSAYLIKCLPTHSRRYSEILVLNARLIMELTDLETGNRK